MNAAGRSAIYPMDRSLYVGDLHPYVTEAMLFEKFSSAGPILFVRVCRHNFTRRSLGYAYVTFLEPADAERALDTMNNDTLKTKPMRIMWSVRDPSMRRSGVGSLFIKNLDKSIDNEALHNTFSAFGNILSCKVAMGEDGSKGYGLVCFEQDEAAQKAIAKVSGTLLNGKKVYVGRFIPRQEPLIKSHQCKKFTNVYIKNLGEDVDDEMLRTMCEVHGKVASVKVMIDEKTGRGAGFCFVSFEDHLAAQKCVEEMNCKTVNGRTLFAGRAQRKEERQADLKAHYEARIEARKQERSKLYVNNLDDEFDDEKLRKEFAKFGTITSAKVTLDETGTSKGSGFVCFSSPEEATKAITEMNGRVIVAKPLYVALAQSKETRKAQLSMQLMQRVSTVNRMMPTQQVGQVYPNYNSFYAPNATTPAQRGTYTAGQVAHVRNPLWPQPQAHQGGQPVQPVPATINPAHCDMDAASQVAHMQPSSCPQPQAQPGGKPVQP